jgi:hypothetical protein
VKTLLLLAILCLSTSTFADVLFDDGTLSINLDGTFAVAPPWKNLSELKQNGAAARRLKFGLMTNSRNANGGMGVVIESGQVTALAYTLNEPFVDGKKRTTGATLITKDGLADCQSDESPSFTDDGENLVVKPRALPVTGHLTKCTFIPVSKCHEFDRYKASYEAAQAKRSHAAGKEVLKSSMEVIKIGDKMAGGVLRNLFFPLKPSAEDMATLNNLGVFDKDAFRIPIAELDYRRLPLMERFCPTLKKIKEQALNKKKPAAKSGAPALN